MKTVDGITNKAWDGLVAIYGRADVIFCAALAFGDDAGHGLRLLAEYNYINPDA